MFHYIPLKNRHIFNVTGEDSAHFLQGLLTNDIRRTSPTTSIYACMLTPQGKYLYDFFISPWEGGYMLDAGTSNPEALLAKLKMYKLRSKVEISHLPSHQAVALLGKPLCEAVLGNTLADQGVVYYIDPRHTALGGRAVIAQNNLDPWCKEKGFSKGEYDTYDHLRLSLGVPDAVRDLVAEASFPLAFDMERLHAIDFNKGCYVGQEVTARSKYRGSVKKSLYVVESTMPLPPYSTPITTNGKKIGEMLSSQDMIGLALLREEGLEESAPNYPILAGDVVVRLKAIHSHVERPVF